VKEHQPIGMISSQIVSIFKI